MNSPKAHLRLLATSDVHMHVVGWDALRDTPVSGRGMDNLAPLIAIARQEAAGTCLLLDNGDALQGTPMGDMCAKMPASEPHPWAHVLNALAFDAVGLGNHDFDFGLAFLEQVVAQIDAPVLCASIGAGDVKGVRASQILTRDVECSDDETRQLAIGVTSVLPPQTAIWNHRYLSGRVAFARGVAAARRAVQALKTDGADLVVMLCHSGLATPSDDENFATAIAAQVSGIDAMIMGHTHREFPAIIHNGGDKASPDAGTVCDVPSVMPGYAAEMLGVIDLALSYGDDTWQVMGHSVALRRNHATQMPDAAITRIATPAVRHTRAALGEVITQTDTGFHSYFEMLQSGPSTRLIADAMIETITDHVAGTELAALPVIASVAPMALGGRAGPTNFVEVAEGPLTYGHLSTLCPYPNAIWAAVLTGSDLWAWAERSAVYFSPTRTGLSNLVNPMAPCFNFDILHGPTTQIDPFAMPRYSPQGIPTHANAGRITALTLNGATIAEDAQFLVGMTSYRGAGGGAYPGLTGDTTLVRTDIELKSALRDQLSTQGIGPVRQSSVWEFSGAHDTPTVIETSPNAAQHLDDIAAFDPVPIGLSDEGFLRIKVLI
ncbi:5'-nucleotidase C-terminal domain-containing protein [uncultured Tateyamaria sp.]|uniref:5'-nucleotidase C-terminal domain-containing protein n=1 Tax=uncultured Tateyamaria sp. TaxID=455651 RepID=UPI0026334071|nr:5'-nucleotidase C-terminal domain-containing protein [uncultured Tateyamaria sp.]